MSSTMRLLVSSLLFVKANVLSVDTESDTAGDVTVIEISDETLAGATEGVDLLFGEIDVQPAETRIVGVDAVVRLGESYLDFLADATTAAAETAAAADDAGSADG